MADVLLLGIIIYLFYRFMVGFVIPVFRTTRQVRQQFSQMNSRQNQPGSQAPPPPPPPKEKASASPCPKVGEYIDFEDVK